MRKLSLAQRASVIRSLVEGNSVRATTRMTGASKGAILRLLVEVGEFCAIYQHHVLTNLPCKRVEADELWGYVGARVANATKPGQGDLWTYIGLDSDSKLVITWLVGDRSHEATHGFMADLAGRLANRVQLTTDGLSWYKAAAEDAFGWGGADYSQMIKVFGSVNDTRGRGRHSAQPEVVGVEKTVIFGTPDFETATTSYIERQNLTIRMGMKRMARLSNGFSKKAENHAHAFAIHMMHYNFCRPHMTLNKANGKKTTPAMASGLTDHVWTVEEVFWLMDPKKLLQ